MYRIEVCQYRTELDRKMQGGEGGDGVKLGDSQGLAR